MEKKPIINGLNLVCVLWTKYPERVYNSQWLWILDKDAKGSNIVIDMKYL